MTGQPFDTLEPAPSSVGLSQGCAEGADSNVDEFDYDASVTRMLIAMRVIADTDVEKILSAISYADALAPFIDPTAYGAALQKGDMHAIEDLARALRKPIEVWRKRVSPKIQDPFA